MKYCPNCGVEILTEQQRFCEKCGASIPSSVKQSEEVVYPTTSISPMTMGFQSYDRPGGLFDISRNYFILKEK